MCSTFLLPDLSLLPFRLIFFSVPMTPQPVEPSLYTQTPLASRHPPLHCNDVSRFVCAGRTWCVEDSRYRFKSCCFDWLRLSSCDAVEDLYDPEVPNRRLLPCSVWTINMHPSKLSMHDIITITPCSTLDIQFTVPNPIRRDKGQHWDEATAADHNALNVGVRRTIMTSI